jgi:hypothetical protein
MRWPRPRDYDDLMVLASLAMALSAIIATIVVIWLAGLPEPSRP